MGQAGSFGGEGFSLVGGTWGIPEVCPSSHVTAWKTSVCHSWVLNLGKIKSHCLCSANDPQNQQDELWRVAVFLSGSIIFGFQQPSFVLKCPALGHISEERS